MRQVLISMIFIGCAGCSDSTTGNGLVATSNADDGSGDAVVADSESGSDAALATDAAASTDAVEDDDVATGAATCTQVGQCVQDDCEQGKLLCGNQCVAMASGESYTKGMSLVDCINSACTNKVCVGKPGPACMNPCVATFCGGEMATCFASGQDGSAPCSTLLPCFDACDKAAAHVFTCQSACYNALTAEGKAQIGAFLACSKTAASTADALQTCKSQLLLCAGGGNAGTSSCIELAECGAKCKGGDNACGGKCYASASGSAQNAYLAIVACFAANQSNPGVCLDQTEACANPSGTGKCANTLTCIGDCQKALGTNDDKGYCAMECLHQLAKPGADAAVDVLKCASAKCPACLSGGATCQSCITASCGTEVLACAIQ